MRHNPDRLTLVEDCTDRLQQHGTTPQEHSRPDLRLLPDPPTASRFDPEETISLHVHRHQNPWIMLLLMGLLGGGGFWLGTMYHRLAEEPAPALEPVPLAAAPAKVVDIPAPMKIPTLPTFPTANPYAVELACAYFRGDPPTSTIVNEFDALFGKAKQLYSRSTELQIRDAVYTVSALQAYNRPDLNPLSAFRMIVDWAPSDGSAGSDVPVSKAVNAIAQDVVGSYNAAIQAQWDAYYAQEARIAQNIQRARAEAKARAAAEEMRLQQIRAEWARMADEQMRWRMAYNAMQAARFRR